MLSTWGVRCRLTHTYIHIYIHSSPSGLLRCHHGPRTAQRRAWGPRHEGRGPFFFAPHPSPHLRVVFVCIICVWGRAGSPTPVACGRAPTTMSPDAQPREAGARSVRWRVPSRVLSRENDDQPKQDPPRTIILLSLLSVLYRPGGAGAGSLTHTYTYTYTAL